MTATTYAYIRVSTDKQDLDNQRHGVIEYAQKNKLEPLTFIDDTASGKKSWKERDLGKLFEQAKAGDVLLGSCGRTPKSVRSELSLLSFSEGDCIGCWDYFLLVRSMCRTASSNVNELPASDA